MTDQVKKDFEVLEELIRRANQLINPEDSLSYLLKKDIRDRLYGEKPKCFIKLQAIGQNTAPYLLPICNRSGIEDPKVINVSIKLVQKLMTDTGGKFDINSLQTVLNALQHRHNTFNKEIPKPASPAARKAHVTRMFKNIKNYLDMTKTSAIGEE